MERELEVIFARASRRMTTPRKEIFRVFQNSNEPLSVATISTQCSNIDRTSVYRTIELFIQLNVVKPVQLGWRQRYELADPSNHIIIIYPAQNATSWSTYSLANSKISWVQLQNSTVLSSPITHLK